MGDRSASGPARFAVASRRAVTPAGVVEAVVVVGGGRIEAVLPGAPPGIETLDLGDLVLMPGLVDSHVHVNEPGRTEWEGFRTATRAAARGGITTIVDMPLNCIPVTTTAAALEEKLTACAPLLSVDCAFWGGVVPGNAKQLERLVRRGVMGAKAFLCHSGIEDFPNVTEDDLSLAMPVLADAGVPLLAHAELVHEIDAAGPPEAYRTYLASRPRRFEDEAVALLIRLARATRCPVHVVHLSSASAVPMIAEAKADGVPITVETCPHYLCLTAEEVPDRATSYKCAPPIREAENRDRLWQAIRDGHIDLVVSDHSPCTPELKLPERGDFLEAWGGIASLQLGLSSVWTEGRARGLSIEDVVRLMSERPARLAGLGHRKGRLERGYDADLVAFDPDGRRTVTADRIEHRHKVTPYLARELSGVVRHTWLRGVRVVEDENVVREGAGRPLLRGEA
jgi:allantoinase